MQNKVISTIEKYSMIRHGDGIVVGLSGGPDSVCLLHVLNSIRHVYDIKLYAVHLNHMIRGDEAGRDEEYARNFSGMLGIPFFSERIKVEEYAKEHGMSSEEAGRFLRYDLFGRIMKSVGANKIALAHNMNDQAETLLMRFLRGTGISGLGGIKPVREDKYIRPIISCSRDEIEEYCKSNNLNPVIDSTNKETIYTRNRIRLELIPYIKENFNPRIIENLSNVSEIIRDDDDYLNSVAAEELNKIRLVGGVKIMGFNELNTSIKRRAIRMLIEEAKGDLTGIESKHIDECIDFVRKAGTGKSINLPSNIRCETIYDIFRISKEKINSNFDEVISIQGITDMPLLGIRIKTKLYIENNAEFIDRQYVKYFDYDKIKCELHIRNRCDGDYMYPRGMKGSKKIKDIFMDKKIPRDERDTIPLIVSGNEVLWIINMRDTGNYKPDVYTKRILEIMIERGEMNG